MEGATTGTVATTNTGSPASTQPRRPRPNRARYNANRADDQPDGSENPGQQRKPPQRRTESHVDNAQGGVSAPSASNSEVTRPHRVRTKRNTKPNPHRQQNNDIGSNENATDSQPIVRPGGQGPSRRRGAKFNPGLTEPSPSTGAQSKEEETSTPARPRRNRYKNDGATLSEGSGSVEGGDLASTLARALRTPPYPDCPICFSPIHPAQRTWSCSPSIPVIPSAEASDGEEQQYCWTTFHTKCIGEWATKSVKAVVEAWRARGEEGKKGDWRCPGCQGKREVVPSGYWCFCGSTADPKPPRIATPHSCGSPCSRIRSSGCDHPCPLNCHPGPCPPCQVTTQLQCYCPRKKMIAFRCGVDKRLGNRGKRNLSCREVCGRPLGCGQHACDRACHEGSCGDCPVKEVVRCYCGKEEKEVSCGWGEKVNCVDEKEGSWIGRWKCDHPCERLHNCSVHSCSHPCHPPHPLLPCPRSPEKITHCPCGFCAIARSPNDPIPNTTSKTFPARQTCTDPIPTCNSPCNKILSGCGHQCVAKCHEGSCPPCTVPLVRPCRCGATTKSIKCYELRSMEGGEEKEVEILCDKTCAAFRACGKHQCRRLCCPLATLATTGGKKGKKRAGANAPAPEATTGIGEEQGGLHECDLVCGKLLSCGLHKCEEKDHRNSCPPCLRSSFEELVCFCGRTVLEPPIPCGTTIRGHCPYPCPRPPPPCGHSPVPHACHEEPQPCPPCPHLTTKLCACGKTEMTTQRCSLEREKVSCGERCGKLLNCGWHTCDKTCHSGDCGDCTKLCGKTRRLCLPAHHPCTLPCHAPASCSEDTPCTALIALSCPCGRIQRSVACGRSTSNPSGPSTQHSQQKPKCNTECSIAVRNAKLAAALGVTKESRERVLLGEVKYNDDTVKFGREDPKFLHMVEKAFEEFISSSKPAQVLPSMPPERRKFVHDLAGVYRMDTQMLDQDPCRSVRLLRRQDARVPHQLLSAHITGSGLGKLADLRTATNSPVWRSSTPAALKPTSASPTPSRIGTSLRPAWGPVARPAATTSAGTNAGLAPGIVSSAEGKSRPHTPSVTLPAQPVTTTSGPEQAHIPDDWEDEA